MTCSRVMPAFTVRMTITPVVVGEVACAWATDGLDKNTSGLDAAQKRMGYLRRMTEGRGWRGRMMMYAWIGGLMFVALFIVGFLPKLRF